MRTIGFIILTFGIASAGGFLGVYLWQSLSENVSPVGAYYMEQAKLTSIDTVERTAVLSFERAEGRVLLLMHMMPSAELVRRAFVRENGIIKGTSDTPLTFLESLIPGDTVEVTYRLDTKHRRFEAVRVITGELLPTP